MVTVKPFIVLTLSAAVILSACSKKDGKLMNLRSSGRGPDEFAILPTKPLETPKTYAVLPDPTPGGKNRVDLEPNADAVAALGGSRKAYDREGISAGDQGVVQTAARYGIASGIRTTLAEEDKEFRSKHRGKLLERLFGNTVYFQAYKDESLDRYAELKRLRRAGVRTPAAPPNPEE